MTQPILSTIVKGIEFSVLGVEINKTLTCPDHCTYSKDPSCQYRNKSTRNPIKGSLVCSLIKANIKNFTDRPLEIDNAPEFGHPKIIDHRGFSFGTVYFCAACTEVLPKDFIEPSTSLMPKSQINTIFACPELDPDASLHRFIYSKNHEVWDLVIGESSFKICEQEAKEKEAKAMGITSEELQGSPFLSLGIGGYFFDINRKIKPPVKTEYIQKI